MSLINCPGCDGLINLVEPICVHCRCDVKATQGRQDTITNSNNKKRVNEVKKTVDVVFFRILLLSFLLFMAKESLSFLAGSYSDYSTAKNNEYRELKSRIAEEQAEKENRLEAKRKEVEDFNNYYNSEYQKQKNLTAPVDPISTTDLVNSNSQEAISYQQRRSQESLQRK